MKRTDLTRYDGVKILKDMKRDEELSRLAQIGVLPQFYEDKIPASVRRMVESKYRLFVVTGTQKNTIHFISHFGRLFKYDYHMPCLGYFYNMYDMWSDHNNYATSSDHSAEWLARIANTSCLGAFYFDAETAILYMKGYVKFKAWWSKVVASVLLRGGVVLLGGRKILNARNDGLPRVSRILPEGCYDEYKNVYKHINADEVYK